MDDCLVTSETVADEEDDMDEEETKEMAEQAKDVPEP